MDSLITAAGRALAAGDPFGALNRVALREDAPALALRGIAMAQLGDLARAKALLKRAGRGFGVREPVARARCALAQAEIALVSRDLSWPAAALDAARAILETHGDRLNAAHARTIAVRRLLLIGRLGEAERLLADFDESPLPPVLEAARWLATGGIALRRLQAEPARAAFARAAEAADRARIPALIVEVETVARMLAAPAAGLIAQGERRPLMLGEVAALLASGSFVVDACRNVVREAGTVVPLATRPVLFALARALAEAWPMDVSREVLLARAFRAKEADESHRARLRVEIGRLRAELHGIAQISATKRGFALKPHRAGAVAVLAQPLEGPHADVLALLADGEAWSSSALALALGTSQRNMQRALEALAVAGKIQSFGQARARRWLTPPVPGFPTALLLPVLLPDD
ncbi:tetratricopeptide (TPR) repeat protein [Ancylobacter sp. 3268]|uniref:helix-turn-helix domain-containing protein n=1 Tax=Ancylobacter sp. 3268 TaxID=2817752 RepID=UPI0028620829|nr:helix-turn-helix domain-containing protein [Ancylobacter sp. 3268]MDR6955815.1 tetratricopeptide (TPR) repeat protein [Ancylobacter sp. 3268]